MINVWGYFVNLYSKSAIPQLIKIIPKSPHLPSLLSILKRRWPYQAIVIKLFETIRSRMLSKPLFINLLN